MAGPFDRLRGPQSPISWRRFEAASFAEAQSEDRLILLLIVAQWCPYSQRLLERLSRDASSQQAILRGYVALLVDSDDAPAIHTRYSGGGWPTIAVLTATGDSLWRGTQIDEARFAPFLRAWLEGERSEVEQATDTLPPATVKGGAAQEAGARVLAATVAAFDRDTAMFRLEAGGGPRFPQLDAIDLLIDADQPSQARDVARVALERVMRGGLWDEQAGGLRRYGTSASVEDIHGEKLLRDGAALLSTLASAAKIWPEGPFAADVGRVADWIVEALGAQSPTFAASIRPPHAEVPDDWAVPKLDSSILIDANARMVSALLAASDGMGEWASSRALELLEWIWAVAWSPQAGVAHRVRDGEVVASGELADAVAVLEASLDAHAWSGDERWLTRARDLFDDTTRRYRSAGARLSDLPTALEQLAQFERPGRLRVLHTPLRENAVFAECAARLGRQTGEAAHAEAGSSILRELAPSAADAGLFGARFALAVRRISLESRMSPENRTVPESGRD